MSEPRRIRDAMKSDMSIISLQNPWYLALIMSEHGWYSDFRLMDL
jgi:hypothetical protein